MKEISNEYMGQMIREVREQRGLQQKELAAKIGEQPSTLSKIETGSQEASIKILVNISKELDVRLEYLLGIDKDIDEDTHLVHLFIKKFFRVITGERILKGKRAFAPEDFEDFSYAVNKKYVVLEGPKRIFTLIKKVAIANGKGEAERKRRTEEAFRQYREEAGEGEETIEKYFFLSQKQMQNLAKEYVKREKQFKEVTEVQESKNNNE